MQTVNEVKTSTETSEFGYYDSEKEEFYSIVTDEDIKKYANKLKNSEFLMNFVMWLHNNLKECICEDLTDIWERLDRIEK